MFNDMELVGEVLDCATNPADVLESFVRFLEAEEIREASRLLSEQTISRVGQARIENVLTISSHDVLLLGGIEGIDVQTLGFSKDHSELQMELWYGDHTFEIAVVVLIREGGKWRLLLDETARLQMLNDHKVNSFLQAGPCASTPGSRVPVSVLTSANPGMESRSFVPDCNCISGFVQW